MEFVAPDEVSDLLRGHRVREVEEGEQVHLCMDGDETVLLHLTCSDGGTEPLEGAQIVRMDEKRLIEAVDHIIHRLRPNEVLLFPVGKWRNVFDVVAFSLADNEVWQEVDAAATVELNTRDPLLCVPVDFPTLNAMLRALMADAESPDQGLSIVISAAPVMLELVPEGVIRVSVGNQALTDQISESLGLKVGG